MPPLLSLLLSSFMHSFTLSIFSNLIFSTGPSPISIGTLESALIHWLAVHPLHIERVLAPIHVVIFHVDDAPVNFSEFVKPKIPDDVYGAHTFGQQTSIPSGKPHADPGAVWP
ncbi:hypothetical protein K458DRAFT_397889 [Lentithecium fluviatile CBS 122367]|uniref:Tautomerase cis-CaaD-like domain-containing protein n=1 Tax=Lentithecium fluviatile CBS 122367 TaxID=1168545 RepID=A0A6G1JMD2_9PLEO|nr:hypothetical protein K458DRAFT_397889 [Lentithecium fluviatile CBS 122367]